MTAGRARPSPAAGDDGAPSTRNCADCVPELWIQGGAWGWAAHRYALHGEGEDPGLHPSPARGPEREWKPWTEEQRAEFHRRRRAAHQRQRYAPPATPPPRPPRGTG